MMKQSVDALLISAIIALFRVMDMAMVDVAHQSAGVLKSMDLAHLVQHRMQQHGHPGQPQDGGGQQNFHARGPLVHQIAPRPSPHDIRWRCLGQMRYNVTNPLPELMMNGRNCLTRPYLPNIRPMRRTVRHISRLLRLPALVVLLFAVVSNPLLAAVGDVHELSQASVVHADPAHCDVADDEGTQDDDDAGDLLHALFHGAHACGHPVGLATPAFVVEPFFGHVVAPDHAIKLLDSLQPLTITRPPITA